MKARVLVIAAVLIFASAYAMIFWWSAPPEPWEPSHYQPPSPPLVPKMETEEPVMRVDGKWVSCDPFTEIRHDLDATKAKYQGKTVLLHGVALESFGYDGGHFLRCSGPRGQEFFIRKNDDTNFERVWVNTRVVVKATLSQIWAGSLDGFFRDRTVWNGELQEIQIPADSGWKVVWRLKDQ
ncbi:MAG: hypothetical protein ACJ8F7_06890 [Gemmataceae bacterium]